MNFKEWLNLQEVGTTTSSVAVFKMPLFGGLIRRMYPEPITMTFMNDKKNKYKS